MKDKVDTPQAVSVIGKKPSKTVSSKTSEIKIIPTMRKLFCVQQNIIYTIEIMYLTTPKYDLSWKISALFYMFLFIVNPLLS